MSSTAAFDENLTAKRERLLEVLVGWGRVGVAFSAGVDSTVVAQAAKLACGEKAVAVTAVSPSLAVGELDEAVDLAERIGIRHVVLETSEFENADYTANPGNRCYFCKTELYTRFGELRPRLGVDVIVNGANLDDRGDHRPGMRAADEHGVRSPLIEAGCTKADVRALAALWGLPNHDKPARPCLSSRIAYGVEVTPERVARVDRAESFLRATFGLRDLRVRLEANELARIEVPEADVPQLVEARAQVASRLRELGFRYVTIDLEGYRSGNMNAALDSNATKLVQLSPSPPS